MKNTSTKHFLAGQLFTRVVSGAALLFCSATPAHAQVNSGSNGSDGAFNPTANITITMTDHPNGIYQYTSVSIPSGVTVTFIPNANNSPVTWLVQSNCEIDGIVNLSGQNGGQPAGGVGGPGGWRGGTGIPTISGGQGPGAGLGQSNGGNASYATLGSGPYSNTWGQVPVPGSVYGNSFLIPILGGSGGGGSSGSSAGGGGGGGAILIAASGTITVNGTVNANGGNSASSGNWTPTQWGGGGSGGAVRFVASKIIGVGSVSTLGGGSWSGGGGSGWVRFDSYENDFAGQIGGSFTQGIQPLIIPTAGQLPQLNVISVGGVPVSASPTGVLSTPDAVLSAQQNNPIPIVVSCANLPLNTPITVSVQPANGSSVSAVGYNNTGTVASSTATISINIPRGGGLIYATAATSN
jgi:hypothetical protein